MTGISFLDLPPEIRTMIYSYFVPYSGLFSLDNKTPFYGENWSILAALIPLRLCCSQINEELLQCFFTTNPFVILIKASLNLNASDGQWAIKKCDKDSIPILRYKSLRGFCMPYMFINAATSVVDATTSGSVSQDWYIHFKAVSLANDEINPTFADEGYYNELEVEGLVVLQNLVDGFAAETERPYRGFTAKHLEQIIDSFNDLVERKLRAALMKSIERHGHRRSARIASRPRKWIDRF